MDKKIIENEIREEYINFFKKYPNPDNSRKKNLYEILLEKSINNKLKDYEFFFQGNLKLIKGYVEEAKKYLIQAIIENGKNPFPYNSLGLINFRDNNIDKAIEYYKIALKHDDSIYFIWYNLGRAFEYKEDYLETEKCYNNALSIFPNDAAAIIGLKYIKKKQADQIDVDSNTKKFVEPYKTSDYSNIEGFFIFADIRGFTKWSIPNDTEIESLFNIFYPLAVQCFGEISQDRKPPHMRVVKFLGDGFFAIEEYENKKERSEILQKIINNTKFFIINFDKKLKESEIVGKSKLSFGFGITYGKAGRFKFKGSLDWAGNKVNYAARFCSVAEQNEIVLEEDFQDILKMEANNITKTIKNYGKIPVLSIKVRDVTL
ncbi:MAG: adenylate/guanylate cyclase domain-containing protein [Promethearchaeota archaeon]